MTSLANKMNRIRFDAMREALQAATSQEKQDLLPIETAKEFNRLLADFGEANPDFKPHLPPPIKTNGLGDDFGLTQIRFLSFEILLRQMGKIFDLVEGD